MRHFYICGLVILFAFQCKGIISSLNSGYERTKNHCPSFGKTLGNDLENYGQCFLKLWAMFFRTMGNEKWNDGQRFFHLNMQNQDEATALLIGGVKREGAVQLGGYQCADGQT